MTQTHTAILGRALCVGGGSLGFLVLVGWFAGMESLFTVVSGRPPMAPDAAFALLLLGLAGALVDSGQSKSTQRLLAKLMGAVVTAIGVEIAVRYALGIQLPLDRFFFGSQAMPYLGRWSQATAVALIFLGAAILLFDFRPDKRARPSEWLILGAGLVATMALLGCLYGAHAYYRVSGAPILGLAVPRAAMRVLRFSGERLILGIAVPGALGALLICVGLLLERPYSGVMRVFSAPGPGSTLLKRWAPAAILIPVVLGFVAARLPSEDVPLALAALTTITAFASIFLLGITAAHLNRAHEALEYAHKRARVLIDSASDAIFIADLGGRISEVNEAGSRLTGYSREDLLSKNITELIPREDEEQLRSRVAQLLDGHTDVGEWIGVRKDGARFPVEVSAKILPDGRWQGIVRDIRERKRFEEALRLSEAAARRAAEARDEVLGIVAHDLRNPLQIITINARLLPGSEPEPARKMAAEVRDAAARMNRLIQDLVDATRIESGHVSLRPERIYVDEIVSEARKMEIPLATSASLELRAATARDLPDIWADHDRILQVFENLIGNAIKFTKAGGRITLGAERSAGEVVFSVSDTGSGIADSDLPHVFDRFWQASHGSHRGAGLGLAIVKGIVEAHYGRIWIRSTAGQGTTFFFTIPTLSQARKHKIGNATPELKPVAQAHAN